MFGPHLLLDLYDCDRDSLICLNTIFDFLDKLPSKVGMIKIDQPKVFKYFDESSPNTWGVTGSVIISTSHISIHTFPDRGGFCSIDLYSCKNFDASIVLEEVIKIFKPEDYEIEIKQRGTKYR